MKGFALRLVIAVVLLAVFLPGSASAAATTGGEGTQEFAPGEILVRFSPKTPTAEIASIHRQHGGLVKKVIPSLGVQVVAIPDRNVKEKVRAYKANSKVLFAEPNYSAQLVGAPDDAYFDNQWGMKKVEAMAAWDITTGSSDVRIAIVDTGVDSDHPDLRGKVTNAVNMTDSPTAEDVHGHGTHVAGIAAAATNNGVGVAGLGYSSTILNVKVLGDTGTGYYSWIANGIVWAADHGAQVINLSLGGTADSATLRQAVDYAWQRGVVVVAAAGNSGSTTPLYPAYYANSLAVAATDSSDRLTSWSNRGDWVDVGAPGASIYSSLVNGSYGYKSGTSMASPHVAGLAALLCSVLTDRNGNGQINDEVRARIESTADDIGVAGIGGGRINARAAVIGGDPPAQPGAIVGRVTDASSGSPIVGATVTNGAISASTGPDGAYVLEGVLPGQHRATASAAGYASASASVTVVSGQTALADFVLNASLPPTPSDMWVRAIAFRVTGTNLRVDVNVVADHGPVSGARVSARLEKTGGQSWTLSGITDSIGKVSFALSKPASGEYVATVTGLVASGHTWDASRGITSASYTFSGGKPGKR